MSAGENDFTKVKLFHIRTSRAGFALFCLGFVILVLGISEILLATFLEVLSISKVRLIRFFAEKCIKRKFIQKIKSSLGVIAGLFMMGTGMIGILAAKSRLRLYVLMTIYGLLDMFSLILLLSLFVVEIIRLTHQRAHQIKYWTTLKDQLNFTKPINFWDTDDAVHEVTRKSKYYID